MSDMGCRSIAVNAVLPSMFTISRDMNFLLCFLFISRKRDDAGDEARSARRHCSRTCSIPDFNDHWHRLRGTSLNCKTEV